MSFDGRRIAFTSVASNLVPGDRIQCPGMGGPIRSCDDVFVRDVYTGLTQMVSLSSSGRQANADSQNPSISGDGTKVAFESSATNLDPRRRTKPCVYVRDLVGHTTKFVHDAADSPSLSYDGRYVAFTSRDGGHPEIYVQDVRTGQTSLVSVSNTGQKANGTNSYPPKISSNGRFVVFTSDATDLVSGDTNRHADVFVRDLLKRTTELVSIGPPDANLKPETFSSVDARGSDSISGDGNLVSFVATATADPAEAYYIRDRAKGKTTFIAYWLRDQIGSEVDAPGPFDELSPDGERLSFLSQYSLDNKPVYSMAAWVYTVALGTASDGSYRRASGDFLVANWPGLSGTGGRVVFAAVPPNCTPKYGECWSIYFYSIASGKTTPVVVIG